MAVLADCPEKAFALKTSLLGTYGQIAFGAAEVDPNVLPDCKFYFIKRKVALVADRHGSLDLSHFR